MIVGSEPVEGGLAVKELKFEIEEMDIPFPPRRIGPEIAATLVSCVKLAVAAAVAGLRLRVSRTP